MSQRPRRTSVQRPERYRRLAAAPERPEQVPAEPVTARDGSQEVTPVAADATQLPDGDHTAVNNQERVRWGEMMGIGEIRTRVEEGHKEIVT